MQGTTKKCFRGKKYKKTNPKIVRKNRWLNRSSPCERIKCNLQTENLPPKQKHNYKFTKIFKRIWMTMERRAYIQTTTTIQNNLDNTHIGAACRRKQIPTSPDSDTFHLYTIPYTLPSRSLTLSRCALSISFIPYIHFIQSASYQQPKAQPAPHHPPSPFCDCVM